jgi:hypothetical protein
MKTIQKIIVFVTLILLANSGFTQDIIILKTGDEIQSKVEEVGTNIIKYHKFENLTGPIYSIEKAQVFMIKYKNGTKDVFNTESTPAAQQAITPQTTSPTQPTVQGVEELRYKKGGAVAIKDKYLTKAECITILEANPDALQAYNTGMKLLMVGNIISYATVIPGLAVSLMISQEVLPVFPFAPVTIAILTAGLVSDIILTVNGRHKIRDAVNVYNKGIK